MMQPSPYHFLPFALLFYFALVGLLVVVVALIEIGVLHYTAERLGIERRRLFLLLMLCLLGSYVNLPVAQFPPEPVESGKIVTIYGVPYVVPVVREWPGTIVAINVGGALVPTALAIYLLIRNRLYVEGLVGVVVVSLLVHSLARPVRGIGISVPTFIPPVAAAVVAVLLSRRQSAPLAYVSGTLGTLIGADLTNLALLPGLGAPVASIGGAGTFDGVFLTGILAVLLA
jgi:uncharacterized membrane protein